DSGEARGGTGPAHGPMRRVVREQVPDRGTLLACTSRLKIRGSRPLTLTTPEVRAMPGVSGRPKENPMADYSFGYGGIGSGLDISSIVSQLVTADRAPQ